MISRDAIEPLAREGVRALLTARREIPPDDRPDLEPILVAWPTALAVRLIGVADAHARRLRGGEKPS